ncbi:MAG: response regulator [Mariprofundaceae bacterium]|nr:response regulator [Mariprofundaceae bacterium]
MQHLLVIEDQLAVREVIVDTINDMDRPLNIVEAASLAEAQALFDSRQWDAIITDCNLGDGRGLDFIAGIRKQGLHIPVIMVSGFLSPTRIQRAEELGVQHVLAKPFKPAELEASVKALLGSEVSDSSASAAVCDDVSEKHCSSDGKLLPKLFDMDRNKSLLFRIINELPREHEVAELCRSALSIALDIARADRGFACLYDRGKRRLVMAGKQCGPNNNQLEIAPSVCALDDTPFGELLQQNGKSVEMASESGKMHVCWPQVDAENFMAWPMRLQRTAMGVLCLMDRHVDGQNISQDDRDLLGMLIRQLDTLLDNRAVHAALSDSAMETLIALVHSLEARDRYTRDHSERVGKLAVLLAGGLGLTADEVSLIRTGGRLHDIGKVGIPDAVLFKPGRYTDRDFAVMKAHPAIGDAILRHMDTLAYERQMVRHHHERIDGNGYPDRLKGDQIPFAARIVCVADAIDAMTSHRVYRMAQPMPFCVEQLKRNSGTQFDADVVAVALSVIDKGYVTTQASQQDVARGEMPLSVAA